MDILANLNPETMRVVWLALFAVLMIIEIATVGLTTIWFAAGCIVAFLFTFAGLSVGWQIGIFLVVSVALLVFTRPWALKYINKKTQKTNYESVIGQTVRVTQTIDNMQQTGKAMLGGQEWTARSAEDDTMIEQGRQAVVEAVKGVKLIVREKEEK